MITYQKLSTITMNQIDSLLEAILRTIFSALRKQ